MWRGLVVNLLLGACAVAGIGYATRSTRDPNPDLNERHWFISVSYPLVPAGSIVQVQCELADGNYLATALPSLSSILVITVSANDLDSAPRGPFTESCEHCQTRHHVQSVP